MQFTMKVKVCLHSFQTVQKILGRVFLPLLLALILHLQFKVLKQKKEASGTSEPIVVEVSSGVKESNIAEPSNNLRPIPVPQEDAVSKDSDLEKPLIPKKFSSAAELEPLGHRHGEVKVRTSSAWVEMWRHSARTCSHAFLAQNHTFGDAFKEVAC